MANDLITGAYMELHKVVAPSGANTETLLAKTKDAVEVTFDTTVAETTAHMEARTRQKPIIDKVEVSIMGILISSATALSTLGVMNGSNEFRGFGAAALDAVRLKVFKNAGDVAPTQVILFTDVEVVLESLNWPQEDFAEWTGRLLVNGIVDKEIGA